MACLSRSNCDANTHVSFVTKELSPSACGWCLYTAARVTAVVVLKLVTVIHLALAIAVLQIVVAFVVVVI